MFKNIILYIFALIIICGCTEKVNYCIEADDFGFDKFAVAASGPSSSTIHGSQENEYVDWQDSGLVINTQNNVPLLIIVRGSSTSADSSSQWSSWYGSNESYVTSFVTTYFNNTCTAGSGGWAAPDPTSKYGNVNNAPCIFRGGVGLYGLVSTTNPNISMAANLNPSGFTFHLGDQQNLQNGENANLGGYNSQSSSTSFPSNINGQELYFKILDNYYSDNSGQYSLVVKSGATSPVPGPIAAITDAISNMISGMSKTLFISIVTKNDYISAVRAAMILYVTVTALCFLMGITQMTQKEFAISTFKLAVIIQLITGSASWDFFYNYFLAFFDEGLNTLVAMATASATGGGGSNTNINSFAFFDNMTSLFFSRETTAKIMSLFVANFGVALFVVPLIYISMGVFVLAIAKSVLIFISSKLVICLIIALAPIFLVFMMFEITKSFYDNWLKTLIGYCIQPIMLFAALGLMANVIINQIYRMLGFPVCWTSFVKTNVISTGESFDLLYGWKPSINLGSGCSPSGATAGCNYGNILLPGYTIQPNAANSIDGYCAPFTCTAERYYDLPFLDPKVPADLTLMNSLASTGSSAIQQLCIEAIELGLLTYLLLKFTELVPQIAEGISGAINSSENTQNTANGITASMKAAVASPMIPIDMVLKSKTGKTSGEWVKESKEGVYKATRKKFDESKFAKSLYKVGDKMEEARNAVGSKLDWIRKPDLYIEDKIKNVNDRIESGGKKIDELRNIVGEYQDNLYGDRLAKIADKLDVAKNVREEVTGKIDNFNKKYIGNKKTEALQNKRSGWFLDKPKPNVGNLAENNTNPAPAGVNRAESRSRDDKSSPPPPNIKKEADNRNPAMNNATNSPPAGVDRAESRIRDNKSSPLQTGLKKDGNDKSQGPDNERGSNDV